MNLGEVYFWTTHQAIGHTSRDKYHLFVKSGDWNEDNVFLFISSVDYGGDYKITNPPYEFLKKSESYISCNGIVSYSDELLHSLNTECLGHINIEHLKELMMAIEESYTLEARHIRIIVKAINEFIHS